LVLCDFAGDVAQIVPGGEPVMAMTPMRRGPGREAVFIADARPPRIRVHRMRPGAGRLGGLMASPAVLDAAPAAWAASPRGNGRALLWAATADQRLLRFSADLGDSGELLLEAEDETPWPVRALAAGRHGMLYAASEDGRLWRRAPGQPDWRSFAEPGARRPLAPPVTAVIWTEGNAGNETLVALSGGAPIAAAHRIKEQPAHAATFRVAGARGGLAGGVFAAGALPPALGDEALLMLCTRGRRVVAIPWQRLARRWIERQATESD
jgi:hypothetical protein